MAVENLTSGRVSFVVAALAHAVAAFLFLHFANAERSGVIIKPLIAIMFISVVGCAALTFRDVGALASGLFIPTIPNRGAAYVFSLIGGIGGSLTLLNYNYLLRDEQRVAPRALGQVRADLAIAYAFTAVFGVSVMLIAGARVLFCRCPDHRYGSRLTHGRATRKPHRPVGFYVYSIGFWARCSRRSSACGRWCRTSSRLLDAAPAAFLLGAG
jgi:Mn2+/Fe2+ NRAMP family transporter